MIVIVGQREDRIVKCSEIRIGSTESHILGRAVNSVDMWNLGRYKSRERCLEIMQEIKGKIIEGCPVYTMPEK